MVRSPSFCEIVHALKFGVRTTNKKALYHLYRDFDESFPDENKMQRYMDYGFAFIAELKNIHNTNLMNGLHPVRLTPA